MSILYILIYLKTNFCYYNNMNKKLLFFGFFLIFGVFFVNFFNFNNNDVIAQIQDITPPQINVDWNLNSTYDINAKVKIPSFTAQDQSGIDIDNTYIKISHTNIQLKICGQDIQIAEEMYNEYLLDNTKDAGKLFLTLSYHGVYTITYNVSDIYQNNTTKTYTFRCGDVVAPTVEIDENFIESLYYVYDTIVIDTNKIYISDNITPSEDLQLKITLQNNSTGDLCTLSNGYSYTFDTAGEYSLSISVTDFAGNKNVVKKTFTVKEKLEINQIDNYTFSINEFMGILIASIVNPNIIFNYYS